MITEQDIVERLRNHVNHRNGPSLLNGAWQMMLDAADEIISLRAERDFAKDDARKGYREITKLRAERDAAARDMQERCAGWHDAQATTCRDLAKANQGNEVGIVFHALVVDHEVAANVIRALPDAPIVRNLI
jgi:hypothetical protein